MAEGDNDREGPRSPDAVAARLQRLWRTVRSRFARQIAAAVVVIGAVGAAGHFVGGLLGWWDAYERTFGRGPGEQSAGPKVIPVRAEPLSIVVLPLEDLSGATEGGWFADAVLDDLTTEVARLPGSVVIARSTAASFGGRAVDPREVARELRVRYVVRGSVRREGEAVRLDLALVDGETGRQRWNESFEVERASVGRAIDDFALRLGRSLTIAVTRAAGDRAAALPPAAAGADDLAMQAFALWFRGFNRENITEALSLLERAVAIDPDSVRGWGGLTFMNVQALTNGWASDRASAARRIETATTQLERLDADGHLTYQARVIRAYQKQDWPQMLRLAEDWTTTHRNAVAFGTLGAALYLNGRDRDAVTALERALRLSPRDTFRAEWQYRLSLAHFIGARYEPAREWGQVAEASNPALPWPPVHAAAWLRLGQEAQARRVFDDFVARNPAFVQANLLQRLPSDEPRFVEGRDRLLADLRTLGLR